MVCDQEFQLARACDGVLVIVDCSVVVPLSAPSISIWPMINIPNIQRQHCQETSQAISLNQQPHHKQPQQQPQQQQPLLQHQQPQQQQPLLQHQQKSQQPPQHQQQHHQPQLPLHPMTTATTTAPAAPTATATATKSKRGGGTGIGTEGVSGAQIFDGIGSTTIAGATTRIK